jgi:hypothetical protein
MYEIIKYIRTMIEDARGHLIQSLRNTTRKRKHLNFNDEIFVVEDNDEQNSTDISVDINNLPEIPDLDDTDVLMIYDTTTSTLSKVTLASLKVYINDESSTSTSESTSL